MEALSVVFSFDVEEHHRIEAAAGLGVSPGLREEYSRRMARVTRRLLDLLDETGVRATFYVVGEIARRHPGLVRAMADRGHEVGAHGWDHRRVHAMDPDEFARDVRRCVDALEQATGGPVAGFRAPTFSVTRQTAWAVDVLADCGLRYDSSVFPVRHDRYGVPDAPRGPFELVGDRGRLVELPLTTYRLLGPNLPVAGGGYFRLFPLACLRAGVRQHARMAHPVAMLYFHPWEFDPDQPRLPLGRAARFRTYVGTRTGLARLTKLLQQYQPSARRAVDVVADLEAAGVRLPEFRLAPAAVPVPVGLR
jgi:polysaccharide deacetylase family protein (PEP-CTERM system associated)